MSGSLNPSNWTIGGSKVLSAKGITNLAEAPYKAAVGVNPRSGSFNDARDRYETAGVLAGNYLLPGSSLLTSNIASKGSQKQLSSPLGIAAQIGTGFAGYGVGSGTTGIPASSGGALEASLFGGGGGTAPADGLTPAQQASDPVLAGEGGQAWAPSAGGAVESAPPLADTAATGGAATKAGMSTTQKIALGLMGANAFLGKKQPLNPDLMAGATPAQTTSASILDQYNKGQLNPADQYNIAKWAQDTKASKQEYYAKAGLSDSSMAKQDIASIDAQASAMRDQALQNMLQGGLNAAGIANTATGQAVQLQIQQDQAQQQAQQQFFETLAFSLA